MRKGFRRYDPASLLFPLIPVHIFAPTPDLAPTFAPAPAPTSAPAQELWSYLHGLLPELYFRKFNAIDLWTGGGGGKNVGVHIYIPSKINIILGAFGRKVSSLNEVAALVVVRQLKEQEQVCRVQSSDI